MYLESDMFQKVLIEINEDNSKAAADTVFSVNTTSA